MLAGDGWHPASVVDQVNMRQQRDAKASKPEGGNVATLVYSWPGLRGRQGQQKPVPDGATSNHDLLAAPERDAVITAGCLRLSLAL